MRREPKRIAIDAEAIGSQRIDRHQDEMSRGPARILLWAAGEHRRDERERRDSHGRVY